jgi:hypothetical protein
MLRQWEGKPSISRCFDHSAGKSVRRAIPMPYGSRPSIAALTRSGARKASEIVTSISERKPHRRSGQRRESGQKFRSYRRAAGKGAQKGSMRGAWVEIVIIGTTGFERQSIDSSIDTHQI